MAKQADTFSSRKASGEHKGEAVPVENEDAAIILFKLEGGMVGSINITQVCAGKKNDLQILISGTNEAYEWHQETQEQYRFLAKAVNHQAGRNRHDGIGNEE